MRRVVQQVHCAHWRGTHRLEGGFGFCACHRPPRRQTLRKFGGAVRGRRSAWTAAACRRCVGRAGMKLGLPAGRRGGRIPPEPPVFFQCEDGFHVVQPWRDASHRVPWPGWNRAFQGDAISTGGSRDAWGWSCRRAVAGGETVAQRGGPSGGAPAVQAGSECATAEGTAGQRGGGGDLRAVSVPVQAHGAVLESGWG